MNKEEWDQWKRQPETAAFFEYLDRLREFNKEAWAGGAFEGGEEDTTPEIFALRQARVLGEMKALSALITVDYEDYTQDLNWRAIEDESGTETETEED